MIQTQTSCGSLFYNYKKYFNIVLLAVCNADYQFTMVDMGEAGRQSDGGVFTNSDVGYCITKDIFQLPSPRALDSTETLFPYVFVADDAFPLRHNIVKPYEETKLDILKLEANYRIVTISCFAPPLSCWRLFWGRSNYSDVRGAR